MGVRGYAGGKLAAQAIAGKGGHLMPPPGATAEFVRLWKVTVEDYPPEHFREGDRIALEAYIELSLTLRALQEQMKGEPLMIDGPHGTKANPILSSIAQISGKVIQFARSLRLTPSARIQTNATPRQSEMKKADQAEAKSAARTGGIRLAG